MRGLARGFIVVLLAVFLSPVQWVNRDPSKLSAGGYLPPAVRVLKKVAYDLRGVDAERNPKIVAENLKAGTDAWVIKPGRHNGRIEGYADRVSTSADQRVTLFVSTTEKTFVVEAYRMGFYGGSGGRLVWRSSRIRGMLQLGQSRDPGTNMVEAPWNASLSFNVDPDWTPGVYLLKLNASSRVQSYVPLTVRDDKSNAALVIQNSVLTWQAYNRWGGYSLYEGPKKDRAHRSKIVSFDRPYSADGSADFFGAEFPLVSFVESLGLDVTYWTDIDLHEQPSRLLQHRALITLGHDEYWSRNMRRGAETARDKGVNLAFLGANAVFRHIRLEASGLGADRRIVNYRVAKQDPLFGIDDSQVTVNWREFPLLEPEDSLVGQSYECNPVHADAAIDDASSWLFEGTGIRSGDRIKGLIGYEYDRVNPARQMPEGLQILAHSPVSCRNRRSFSDVTYYSAPSGAGVFASGTTAWICTLTASCPKGPHGPPDVRFLLMNVNLLRAFAKGPVGLEHPSRSNLERFGLSAN